MGNAGTGGQMVTPPDETTENPYAVIAALRQQLAESSAERDAALSALAERTTELAHRNREYGERIEHQAATIDVLKVMSASPGNAQPVFDLICRQARTLLGGPSTGLFEYDGELVHLRAASGASAVITNAAAFDAYKRRFPMVPVRGSLTCRAILDGEMVHIRDLAAEPGISQVVLDLGYSTQVSIPLMRDGRAIGAITAAVVQVDGISDSQVGLLRTFAEQAVIAITSAETYRALQGRTSDLQEALEQQTATAEVLQVINASPGDLGPVFDAMLDKAMQLCRVNFGGIGTFDGERIKPVALRGIPAAYADYLMRNPASPDDGGTVARLARGESIVHIQDLMAEAARRNDHPGLRAMVELGGARTSLGVALRKDDAFLGHITAYRKEVRPFSEREIALLQNFAAQAVIAIENTRLLTEQREALQQQTATAEVLQVINASPGNLTPVFDAMLEKAMRLCGAAYGVLRSFDGRHMRMLASHGVPAEYAEFLARNASPPTSEWVPGTALLRALETAQPTQTMDARESVGYRGEAAGGRAIADLGGARTILHVPLVKDQVSLGLFTLYRQEVRRFSDKQIALLNNFAAQAVIAMENARLINETREALEQQTATAEILGVINTSPGDLTPVFDAMLEKAMRLCEIAFGTLATYDGEYFHAVAARGLPPALADYLRHPFTVPPGSTFDELVGGVSVVQIPDVGADDRPAAETRRALVELGGARTGLAIALRKDDEFLARLCAFSEPGESG
jgi:GAF domain-containing protein